MKKATTSKRLLAVSYTSAIALSLLVVFGTFCCAGPELGSLTVVCGCAWAEVGAATGFYYWKAKNENRSKYTMDLIKQFAKDYGIDSVARLAEVILKD